MVNLSGAGIGDKRWTDDYKREVLESRTKSTDLLARTIAGLDRRPPVFVSGSAIGIYGDTGDTAVTEQSPAGDDFLADVCVRWEAAAAPAVEAGIRVDPPPHRHRALPERRRPRQAPAALQARRRRAHGLRAGSGGAGSASTTRSAPSAGSSTTTSPGR